METLVDLAQRPISLDSESQTVRSKMLRLLSNGGAAPAAPAASSKGNGASAETPAHAEAQPAVPFANAQPPRASPPKRPAKSGGARAGMPRKQALAEASAAQDKIVALLLASREPMPTTALALATASKKGTAAHRLEILQKLGRVRRAGPGLWEAIAKH